MANFFEILVEVLKADERFFTEDGTLLRNKVYEFAMNMDAGLIGLLLGNAETKKRFFADVNGTFVFDKVGFGWVVNNRQFLPDSYTRFKNRIGLTDASGDLISASGDVVLSFPYKDCVLEGGQSRDDQKRHEDFYNATLALDEVDRLLYPKVLVGAKRYSYSGTFDLVGNPTPGDGESVAEEITTEYLDSDNLIIKGNNLLALASLLKRFEGKVKCIYIDAPYNTGNDSFSYNDRFSRSTWLTFIKNRLEIARRLLSYDGSIFVHIDYNQAHYLKVLMDDIFGENCFKNEIIWRRKQAISFGSKKFGIVTDSIFYYGRTESTEFHTIYTLDDEHTQKYIAERFVYTDEDGERYMKSQLVNSLYRPNLKYIFHGVNPPKNGWLYSQERMEQFFNNNELVMPKDSNARIYRKIFLKNYQGQEIQSLWTDIPIVNPMADEQEDFSTQKPEKLLQRIIETSTQKGDIVLDFCLGSGTTAVVALKTGRRFIGVEQMDYLDTITVERLKKVILGDSAGISKAVDWHGGGSFVYCELAKGNQHFADEVVTAKTDADLTILLEHVLATGFISSKVNPAEIAGAAADFEALSIDDKKRFIFELLDKNMLYVNLCDLHDEEYAISDADKTFTRSFYGTEGDRA